MNGILWQEDRKFSVSFGINVLFYLVVIYARNYVSGNTKNVDTSDQLIIISPPLKMANDDIIGDRCFVQRSNQQRKCGQTGFFFHPQ